MRVETYQLGAANYSHYLSWNAPQSHTHLHTWVTEMVDNEHSKCVKCYSSLNCSHLKWKCFLRKKKKSSISRRSSSMVADRGATKARVLGIQCWARGCREWPEDFCFSLTPWTVCSVFLRWSSHMRSCVQVRKFTMQSLSACLSFPVYSCFSH